MNTTYSPKPQDIKREWFVVDASERILGRLATEIARRLCGKHKAEYAPNTDMGDFIIVTNAAKIKVTGNKLDQKTYYRYTGYVGNMKEATLREMLQKKPEDVITKAVKGMLPRNRLGRAMLKKLKVFSGAEHDHAAQQPKTLDI